MKWNENFIYDNVFRTHVIHEKAKRSDAHKTLGLERMVLLMAIHDWNKEYKLHFESELCLYSNTTQAQLAYYYLWRHLIGGSIRSTMTHRT